MVSDATFFCLYHLLDCYFFRFVLNNLVVHVLGGFMYLLQGLQSHAFIRIHKIGVVNLFSLHICLLLIWFLFRSAVAYCAVFRNSWLQDCLLCFRWLHLLNYCTVVLWAAVVFYLAFWC